MAIQEIQQQEIAAVSGGIIFGLPIVNNIFNPQPIFGESVLTTDPGAIIAGLLSNGPATLFGILSGVLAILLSLP